MKLAIAGATGFVGKELIGLALKEGHSVVIISRSPDSAGSGQVSAQGYDAPLSGFDAVINLAGAGIADKRWTAKYKKTILDSRITTTRALVERIAEAKAEERPKVLVNASAIGFYGDRDAHTLDESAIVGRGYLPEVCDAWEHEAHRAKLRDVRTVCLRIGIVLGRDGGALQKMLPPFKMFAGGPLGNGRQWMSWVHTYDLARMLLFCAEEEGISGPVNGVAPKPLMNTDFSKVLAKVIGRPCWPVGAPGFMLRLMLGEMADALLLSSIKVVPKALQDAGFTFDYPELKPALEHILKHA